MPCDSERKGADRMRILGGLLILSGCFGLGLWYRQQFLGRLHTIRELICILEQWISEIRYNSATLPECCRQIGRQREDRMGEICTEVYREYIETEGCGFLEIAEISFRRQLQTLPLKKEDIEEFLRFTGKEGYADEIMQIKSIELSRQRLEHTAEVQQQEITQKCRLSVGLGAMSGMLLLLILV